MLAFEFIESINWSESWEHFKPSEVLSPLALKAYEKTGVIGCDISSLDALQEFRTTLGVPIRVNYAGLTLRGYRTPKEHLTIKQGAQMSPHTRGMAFDCTPIGMNIQQFYEEALKFKRWLGIGKYGTFVHLDTWDRLGTGERIIWDRSQ